MKGRILTSLLTVIALTGLQAQNIPAVPRLVVGLTIDQLRTDYIEAFSALYGERGFKRLWKEGRIYRNAEYDFINVDKSSAVAAIYSGTTPYTNGIVGDNWMDRSTLRVLNCVDDADFMGIYTSESTSPQKMKVSTLTDELIIATQGVAEVYSIAPTREMAVLAAGHASSPFPSLFAGIATDTNLPSVVPLSQTPQFPNGRIDNEWKLDCDPRHAD